MHGGLLAQVGAASVLAVAATGVMVAGAAPAYAASPTASVSHNSATGVATISYWAPPGQVNQVVIKQIGEVTFVIDDVVPITAGAGCGRRGGDPDLTVVQCYKADASYKTKLVVDTEDLNDSIDDQVETAYASTLMGGGGDDFVIIRKSVLGFNNAFGNAGNDYVFALGAMPNAILDGGPGADYMCGAGLHVRVNYRFSPQAVYASANGVSGDDGAPGEGDTICSSVGAIDGSEYPDWLFSSTAGGALYGNGGNDAMAGGLGTDYLNGGGDNDLLMSNGGADTLNGGPGNDNLFGGDGNDWLYGWEGLDYLNGEAGGDFLDGGFGPLEADKCVYSAADTYYECETFV